MKTAGFIKRKNIMKLLALFIVVFSSFAMVKDNAAVGALGIFQKDETSAAETAAKKEIKKALDKFETSITLKAEIDRNDIADILALAGAVDSALKLNNIIAERDNENQFNRQSNLYMAHYKKAVDSAQKYLHAIEHLQESGQFDRLDDRLKAVALARVENNDASMQELADMLGTSKTSLSRYLNKLLALAEKKSN